MHLGLVDNLFKNIIWEQISKFDTQLSSDNFIHSCKKKHKKETCPCVMTHGSRPYLKPLLFTSRCKKLEGCITDKNGH